MKNWGLYYMKIIYDMDLFIFIFCYFWNLVIIVDFLKLDLYIEKIL